MSVPGSPRVIPPEVDAGPSTEPNTRTPSPTPQHAQTLRRPASIGRLGKFLSPARSRSSSTASQGGVTTTAYPEGEANGDGRSGRSTPELRRRGAKAAATSLLANDAKYKKFAGQVDRALQSFESVNEWADFISFLSRLLKTLQSSPSSYPDLPRKLIIAKRLAQCLNPALPSGVHQRALDVYAYIFSTIGAEGLKRDLAIWSSGLFPFLQFAATSVRPHLIAIYETYYLPLGDGLRPATKGLILALLPGLEEETGDFFDQVLSLFDRLAAAVDPPFLLQNIFLVLVSSPAARLAALNYFARRMLKAPDRTDPDAKVDTGLMMRGTAAALGDENMLVRRNGLDLLLRVMRLDGEIMRDAEERDKELLMRAVCGIVLHRDLSLSRRVYTWMLGTDETSDKQVDYFRTYGLGLVSTTLENDMERVGDASEPGDAQRPFKVFLSLLDKWEIGSILSERLAVPALEAIRAAVSKSSGVASQELLTMASAVYEAVEPIIIWRTLFASLQDALKGSTTSGELLEWVLRHLPRHDEEIQSVHAPVMLHYLLGLLIRPSEVPAESLTWTLTIALALFRVIPGSALQKPAIRDNGDSTSPIATTLYATTSPPEDALREQVANRIIPDIIPQAFRLHQRLLSDRRAQPKSILRSTQMVEQMIELDAPGLAMIAADEWSRAVVVRLQNAAAFAEVDALAVLLLKASRCSLLEPPLRISSDDVITPVLNTLFPYLRPDRALYHARAVELVWEYNQLAEIHTLENVISRRLATQRDKRQAFDAFGVIWRQTEDSMLPGEIFFKPLCIILDALKSDDPDIQTEAETWMRCNLRSYFRALDPLLARLLDPSMTSTDVAQSGKIDLAYLRYLLDSVSSLFRFGGQGLSKACQAGELGKSPHPIILRRHEAAGGTTYLELLVELATSFLFLETPANAKATTSAPVAIRVQNSAIDLLQLLVNRGDLATHSLDSLKVSLIDRLASTVRVGSRLQSKLLHLLHAVIALPPPPPVKSHQRAASLANGKPRRPSNTSAETASDFDRSLVNVVIQGLTSPATRPVLQHWIDFVLMTIPQLQRRPALLQSLTECISAQLRDMALAMQDAYSRPSDHDIPMPISDTEPTMLLAALERILLLLSTSDASRKSEESIRPSEAGGGSSILGLMSGVFSVEAPVASDELVKPDRLQYLVDAVDALLVLWATTSPAKAAESGRVQTMGKTRTRAKMVLEKLFKQQASGVVSSCVAVWSAKSVNVTDEAIFDMIDALAPSAQRVVELLTEAIAGKQSRSSMAEYHADPAYAAFLEVYTSRLEAPIAVQVWGTLFAFARDVVATAAGAGARSLFYPLLRCLTVLSQKVATTSALEDRRLRRDLQDVYGKVLDLVVVNAGRIAPTALWSRQRLSGVDVEKSVEDNDILGLRGIHEYLAKEVIPNLRTFFNDNDRVSAACNGISINIVTPAFRQQNVDLAILHILLELSKIPPALKAWRLPIGDAFNEPRFFKIGLNEAQAWKPLVNALMDSDRERFAELLARVNAAPSANIFTNREQEVVARSLHLRRLSFTLLAADANHYLPHLPAIQEKLVDMLRTTSTAARVHAEVYLCLRVLLCRMSAQHLANFWPVILSELMRVFEAAMDDLSAGGRLSEDGLQLILAACKFLDLLLVIQSEDFQTHQWMFVTDTTDAAYPPEGFEPDAVMDCLAELITEHSHSHLPINDTQHAIPHSYDTSGPRRPRLAHIRHLADLWQLQPFLSRASIDTFEGVYGDGGVDWDAVEDGLLQEMFESSKGADSPLMG